MKMIFIQIPFLGLAAVFTLYVFVLTILAFLYKTNMNYDIKKWNRFAVIIPAHNEELVIAKTIKNLFEIDFPHNLYDVIVIADNCTDKTPFISAQMGALVLERYNKNLKGKGYALKWCFDLLLKSSKNYDAYFVIDADTSVNKNILQIINLYLNSGANAIQCSDLVKTQRNSWSSEITRVGLLLYNFTKPLGKKVINCSAGLRGNGMCFTSELLKRNPWNAFSQTEDLEYGLKLLLNDVPIIFAPEARVTAIMPASSKNAESQRARWEMGRFPLVKKYSRDLFFAAIKNKSLKLFDAFIDLISPAFVNLFSFTIIMILMNTFFAIFNLQFAMTLLSLWIILLLLQIFHVLGGLYAANADRDAYKALFNVPKYAFWKFILYLKLAFKGHTNLWIRTTRESGSESILDRIVK